MSDNKTPVNDTYERLIAEARGFLAGSGKATLLGRLTDALEDSVSLSRIDALAVDRLCDLVELLQGRVRIETVEQLAACWDTGAVIQEIPTEPMDFYPQIWEWAFSCGWARVGSKYDPDDDAPRLPCRVLYTPDFEGCS